MLRYEAPNVLLICGDKWTEERGLSILSEFWHRQEFIKAPTQDKISNKKAITRLHAKQGGIGVYGFYIAGNPIVDILDGLQYLIPYMEIQKPDESRAFYLQVTDTHPVLIRSWLTKRNIIVYEEICSL